MIVVDASIILEVLLRTPLAPEVEERIFAEDVTLHAPHLIDLEVAQVLRRYVRSEEITADRGRQGLTDLIDFPLNRYPHDPFLPRIWQLRNNVTAYDAAYLVLAEILEAPLLTRDRRLAEVPSHKAVVEVV